MCEFVCSTSTVCELTRCSRECRDTAGSEDYFLHSERLRGLPDSGGGGGTATVCCEWTRVPSSSRGIHSAGSLVPEHSAPRGHRVLALDRIELCLLPALAATKSGVTASKRSCERKRVL